MVRLAYVYRLSVGVRSRCSKWRIWGRSTTMHLWWYIVHEIIPGSAEVTPAERASKCAEDLRAAGVDLLWPHHKYILSNVAIIQRHIEEAERSATDREREACSKAIMTLKPSGSNFGAVLEAIHVIRARRTEEKRDASD